MICPLHSSALFRHAEKVRTGCRGETVHTQTFCRQFLIRNSVIFDVENFSPNCPAERVRVLSREGSAVSMSIPGCPVSLCHLSNLAGKIRFGLFSSGWHCKVLSTATFLLEQGMGSFSTQANGRFGKNNANACSHNANELFFLVQYTTTRNCICIRFVSASCVSICSKGNLPFQVVIVYTVS